MIADLAGNLEGWGTLGLGVAAIGGFGLSIYQQFRLKDHQAQIDQLKNRDQELLDRLHRQ